jgi:hypothetical protein
MQDLILAIFQTLLDLNVSPANWRSALLNEIIIGL